MRRLSSASVRLAAAAIVLVFGTALARAHPGHGLQEAGVVHLLTSPYHLLTLMLSGAVLFGVGLLLRRRPVARLLQVMGLLLAAGATLLWNAGW
jgi:hypothetical protein